MKVFLDDERVTPDGWWRVYEPHQMIEMLQTGMVTHISLDHDLGDDVNIGTGYDVILWIEEQVVMSDFKPPHILIHTSNPSARQKMEQGRKQIRLIYGTKKEEK